MSEAAKPEAKPAALPRQVLPLVARLQLRRDREAYRIGFIAGRAWAMGNRVGLIYAGFLAFALALATADKLNALWWALAAK